MVEVLALTHENATREERMPYLCWLFSPVPVLNLVGRSAIMNPACNKVHCVWYAWKVCNSHPIRKRGCVKGLFSKKCNATSTDALLKCTSLSPQRAMF